MSNRDIIHTQDQNIPPHTIPTENNMLLLEKQQQTVRRMAETVQLHKKEGNFSNIKIIPGELHIATDAAEAILKANNPGIFQRSGQLVRIVNEAAKLSKKPFKEKDVKPSISRSNGALVIIEVDAIYLAETLGKLASWSKYDERNKEWKPKDCPDKIAKTLLARHQWKLPVLMGIIQAPTLRPDGSILQNPGYDEETGLFYNPGEAVFPQIISCPTFEEAITAKDRLLSLLSGFPFEDEESKAVALSGILTALVRKSIRTAPLHGFTAPKMGTGKSLLADVIGLIATGNCNCVISQADSEAEEEKRLLTVLAAGDAIICYDNIERPFGCAPLCSVLSQEVFKGRLLGTNKHINVTTNSTFLATGNNLTLIGDISTRAILCKINPQCEKPEERTFEVNLYTYIPTHRGELVKDALTILRAYHVAGRPKQPIPPFGRFEEWSDFIRSALVWVGLEDACKSRKEIESTDPVRLALRSLLKAWFATFHNLPVKVKTVINSNSEELKEALTEFAPNSTGGINEISLGKKLQKYNKRIEEGLQLERMSDHQGAATWRIIKTENGKATVGVVETVKVIRTDTENCHEKNNITI